MNSYGRQRLVPLKHCRVCGMDAGARKIKEGAEDQFFIVCEICGFKTKPHKSWSAASKEWNHE